MAFRVTTGIREQKIRVPQQKNPLKRKEYNKTGTSNLIFIFCVGLNTVWLLALNMCKEIHTLV
jgi:hypothetical protein